MLKSCFSLLALSAAFSLHPLAVYSQGADAIFSFTNMLLEGEKSKTDPAALVAFQSYELLTALHNQLSSIEDQIQTLVDLAEFSEERQRAFIRDQFENASVVRLIGATNAFLKEAAIDRESIRVALNGGRRDASEQIHTELKRRSREFAISISRQREEVKQLSGLTSLVLASTLLVEVSARLQAGEVGGLSVVFNWWDDYHGSQNDPNHPQSLASLEISMEEQLSSRLERVASYLPVEDISTSFEIPVHCQYTEAVFYSPNRAWDSHVHDISVLHATVEVMPFSSFGVERLRLSVPEQPTVHVFPIGYPEMRSFEIIHNRVGAAKSADHPDNPCIKRFGISSSPESLLKWRDMPNISRSHRSSAFYQSYAAFKSEVERYNLTLEAVLMLQAVRSGFDEISREIERMKLDIASGDITENEYDARSTALRLRWLGLERQVFEQTGFEISRSESQSLFATVSAEAERVRTSIAALVLSHSIALEDAIEEQQGNASIQALQKIISITAFAAKFHIELQKKRGSQPGASAPVELENAAADTAAADLQAREDQRVNSQASVSERASQAVLEQSTKFEGIDSIAAVKQAIADFDALGEIEVPADGALTEHEVAIMKIAEAAYGIEANLQDYVGRSAVSNSDFELDSRAITDPSRYRSAAAAWSIFFYPQQLGGGERDFLEEMNVLHGQITRRLDQVLSTREPDYESIFTSPQIDSEFIDREILSCQVSGCWKQR